MAFRPSGEILIVPCAYKERILAVARNDRLFWLFARPSKMAVENSAFAITSCMASFFPSPRPFPKRRGSFLPSPWKRRAGDKGERYLALERKPQESWHARFSKGFQKRRFYMTLLPSSPVARRGGLLEEEQYCWRWCRSPPLRASRTTFMPHCSTGDDGRFAKIFISKISMKSLTGKYPQVSVQALFILWSSCRF